MRADKPRSSIRVATLFLKLCVVTSGTPSSARTLRHSPPKLFGSRHVPAVDGNIIVGGLARVRQSAPRGERLDGESRQRDSATPRCGLGPISAHQTLTGDAYDLAA